MLNQLRYSVFLEKIVLYTNHIQYIMRKLPQISNQKMFQYNQREIMYSKRNEILDEELFNFVELVFSSDMTKEISFIFNCLIIG